MKNICDKKLVKIGMWATRCCHLDLFQIEDQEDLDDVIEDMDGGGLPFRVWKTKKDALLDLIEVEPYESYEEIKGMLDGL